MEWFQTGQIDKLIAYNRDDCVRLAQLCTRDEIELPGLGTSTAACLKPYVYAWTFLLQTTHSRPQGVQQGTPEWFELRRGKVTASAAGAILGLSRLSSRVEAHERLRGEGDAAQTTPAMERGARLEPLAIRAFQRAAGLAVAPCGPYVHARDGWLIATPDGVVLNESGRVVAVVEAKVPAGGEPRAIDDNYLIQIIVQCACVGVTHGYFASLGARKILVQRVIFDVDVWLEDLRPLLLDFYELRADEFIANVLSSSDAVLVKQAMRDYKRHVSAPRIVEHRLKV